MQSELTFLVKCVVRLSDIYQALKDLISEKVALTKSSQNKPSFE